MYTLRIAEFLTNISSRIGILIIGTIVLCVCVLAAYITGKKEGHSPDETTDEAERVINKTAGLNETPWKARKYTAEEEEALSDGAKTWSKLEKAYEKAPRRANVKRIIWSEKQRDLQRIKDLQEREKKLKEE